MAAVEIIEIKGDASQAIAALKEVGIEAAKTQSKAAEANDAIKDGLSALDKQTGGAVSAFKSLQGGIRSAVTGFKTLKGAIIATGLGALLIAVTSLVTFFTQTERGAQTLRVAMAALGAAVGAVTDAVVSLGEGLLKLFTGDFSGAIETVRKGFANIGTEILNDVKAAVELEGAMNRLKIAERELSVERAEANKELRAQGLIAEDLNRTVLDRIAAIRTANAIETRVFQKELSTARERLRILQEQASLSETNEETLDQIAAARVNVANLEEQSLGKRTELQTKINSLLAEEVAKTKELETARENAEKARFENSEKKFKEFVDKSVEASEKTGFEIARVGQFFTDSIAEGATSAAADLGDYINFTLANLDAVSGAISGFAALAGENTKISKALAMTQIVIDTYQGATKALGAYPPPFGAIAAAGVIAGGIANLRKVSSTQIPTTANASAPTTITAPTAPSQPPQFNIVGQGGVNQLAQSIGGQFNQPVRAYVVGSDVTTSQQLQRQRVRTATFG
jgi:hypothetical protein